MIELIIESGRSALNMAFYTLIPIMVVMLALMTLLEDRGILTRMANLLSPVSRIFGIPGLGVFAMVKLSLVSFAAPIATLTNMNQRTKHSANLAATLAALLTMSQANVIFPLLAVGLDPWFIFFSSISGGLIAASITYYIICRGQDHHEKEAPLDIPEPSGEHLTQILTRGGLEGIKLVVQMIPLLILSLCVVNIIKVTGGITLLEHWLAPALGLIGIDQSLVLPLLTKYIAGGTAFVGVTLDMLEQGQMTVTEMNRIAGLAINPLDLVGFALLLAAGPRIAAVGKPALIGAFIGVACRGAFHLIWY